MEHIFVLKEQKVVSGLSEGGLRRGKEAMRKWLMLMDFRKIVRVPLHMSQ